MPKANTEFDKILNQMVIWLRDYNGHKLNTNQKNRFENLVSKISKFKSASEEELVVEIRKEKRSADLFAKLQHSKSQFRITIDKGEFMECHACNVSLKKINFQRHKKKCKPFQSLSGATLGENKSGNTHQKNPVIDKTKNEDYHIASNLDGSRDFYQIRDGGKFGSYSSFDDYGDESFS